MKKLLAFIVSILMVALVLVVPVFAEQEGIVVDNNDDGSNGFKATAGFVYWNAEGDDDGVESDLAYCEGGDGSEYAEFKPTLSTAGKYNVYTKWNPFEGRATDAPYTIYYKGGNKTVTVDQLSGGDSGVVIPDWYLLGTFEFDAGDSGYVTLTNKANGYVIADAVKFELADAAASTGDTTNAANPATGDMGTLLLLVTAIASGTGAAATILKKNK